jgi:hypothetical protein
MRDVILDLIQVYLLDENCIEELRNRFNNESSKDSGLWILVQSQLE